MPTASKKKALPKFRIDWSGRAHDYSESEIAAVVQAMKTADPQTQGRYLKQFEADFAKFVGAHHAFGVTNCTHALELAADLCRLEKGDEVVLPGHTYCASAIPFARTGAKIRWADLAPETLLPSLADIERVTTAKTKVIVVVHLYGLLNPEIDAIASFARRKQIVLVEDCAQAFGARRNCQHAGTFGDFGCYSFHAQKNITTMGEGGVLTVADPELAKLVPGLRHNGHKPFVDQEEFWLPAMSNVDVDLEGVWPHNFSMCEAQAALGSALLKRLDALNADRRARALKFRDALREFPELVFQKLDAPEAHAHHLLPARYDAPRPGRDRDSLLRLLTEKFGVKAIVQYYPLYRYDLFKKMGLGQAACPETDRFYDNMISIPAHHWMNEADFDYLVDSMKKALRELRG
jgi:perosamine synthetase